ncbi:MAG: LacI family DNA-binding transcriptional regulator [Candidatus Nanopelagicales bacterium]
MSAKPRPTLAHVARAANVSITTASASLRGTGRVNQQTRDHVVAVARRLGYRKNPGASSLREGGGQLVGAVLESAAFAADPLNPKLFWPRFLDGFVVELNSAGIGVVLVSRENLDPLYRAPVEVLLVLADLVEQLADSLPFGMPIIAGSDTAQNVVATVSHDYGAFIEEVIEHLRQRGATRLALMASETPIPTVDSVLDRLYKCAEAHGLEATVVGASSQAVEAAVAGGVDSILTIGTNVGGTIEAVTRAGKSIPGDVLLCSLSEADFTAAFSPAVTTMWLKGYESGRLVAEAVHRGLASGQFESVTLPHELVVRESTGGSKVRD